VRVELVYFTGCPNVPELRRLLDRCLQQCGLAPELVEVNTDEPSAPAGYRQLGSPTVLIDGVDILDGAVGSAESCRLQLPSEAELTAAILGHHEARR
jgi:hypothetical protein